MTNYKRSIGGYFELELPQGVEYHHSAIALNTGRNCLEYILRVRGYKRVYLPYYSCNVILEPLRKLNVDYKFYHINGLLELDEDIHLEEGEALLCINYYGLKQRYVEALAKKYGKQLIVDNTQAFYSHPIEGIDTFYSCRKFFGVSDGAYLYCDKALDIDLEQDQSWQRMDYLLKRIDLSPQVAYSDFRHQSELLINNPIKRMSKLTKRIMQSIDYKRVADKRRQNFMHLNEALKNKNGITLSLSDDAVPMVYPFFIDDEGLRQRLIDNSVFVAQYWPNVLLWCDEHTVDHQLTKQLLPLPIDQRYGQQEMNSLIEMISHIV